MKSIRVVAVGLLLAAKLMMETSSLFFRWWAADTPFTSLGLAINAMSPKLAGILGMGAVAPVVLTLLCLSVGLFLSATVYSVLEDIVLALPANLCRIGAAVLKSMSGPVGRKVRNMLNRTEHHA